MRFKINNLNDLNKKEILEIEKNIEKGSLIIYPTDTVYGLGASIYSKEAINRIYTVKGRNFSSPIIALVSDRDKISEIAYIDEKNSEILKKLADEFWPGALTIILKRKNIVPDIMVSNGETVGIRMPNNKLALEIINLLGGIVPTTSANFSGEPSPKNFSEVNEELKKKIDIVIDGGKCELGEVSTIIDLTKDIPKIIRKGAIKLEKIQSIIGKVECE